MSKEYLDHCYYCNESKAAVRASQVPNGDHIICGFVDTQTGELLSEINGGRHTFVITDVERKRQEDEAEALNQHYLEMSKIYEAVWP